MILSLPRGDTRASPTPTTTMVAMIATMFHQAKTVSPMGMVSPSCSAMNEPSVAAARVPEPE